MSEQPFRISELDYTSEKVIADFAIKMEEKGLYACGFGGREDKGKIIDFKVSFQYGKALDILSARCLIVETVLLFVEEINNNKEVRKYLHHFPFTPSDVIVSILPDCSLLNRKEGSFSIMVKDYLGQVSYSIDDGLVMPLHCLHEETFEEAVKVGQEH